VNSVDPAGGDEFREVTGGSPRHEGHTFSTVASREDGLPVSPEAAATISRGDVRGNDGGAEATDIDEERLEGLFHG